MAWLVYALHALFWAPFMVRGQLDKQAGLQQTGPAAHRNSAATALVWLHTAALGVTYVGIGWGLFNAAVWDWPLAARLLGVPIILATTWMIIRVMMVFRSWRLRAELTAEHQLCTEGPFRLIRHPIYTALVLLSIGSFFLVPNALTALGIVTNFLAGDLRARAEERLLIEAFGERYRTYMARTKRWIPGVF
ncbi:farnesyl cysteine carboxyl-methyltransferase [Deltaproteobacteria bacterium]|nr:farnesyl cysteine carboxyl-methyltransferase [Deltaproteobacteria bacterium]